MKFLTGDDKSTWFWLPKRGYEMAYLPDVRSVSMESQPKPGFVDSAVALMLRWFGNMLRTNGRALALGPIASGGSPGGRCSISEYRCGQHCSAPQPW